MNFDDTKAIYEQMADRLCDEIIAGTYKEDDRIPSVREYAVMLQVNTNTAVKAYDLLSRNEVIYNKRGLGYFVSPGARQQITKTRKRNFISRMLPDVFKEMHLLGISIDEVEQQWELYEAQSERKNND